jgi:hypothetical protein
MYPTSLAILIAFATMVLAAALAPQHPTYNASLYDSSNSTSMRLVQRLDPYQCPANKGHYPDFATFERGVNQFCDKYGNQDVDGGTPLVITLTLNGHNGKTIEWIYKITVDNGWTVNPGTQHCKDKFMGFTKDKGGGVGKAYCNWNESKNNIHDHLMFGGKYDEQLDPKSPAKITWETRAKKGQKWE